MALRMDFSGILRRVAARRPFHVDAPSERENVKEESVEVQAVRARIAGVVKAREAHAQVVEQQNVLAQELKQSMDELAAVQAQLTGREKEIALAGGELPDEPFPEEAEINRLNRHVRIRRERARVFEVKVQEFQEALDARLRDLETSWVAVGAAISERLLADFRAAASALRDAQIGYFSLYSRFCHEWNAACWKQERPKTTIGDPQSAELILNPMHLSPELAHRWPPSVRKLSESVSLLRAEIDAVRSK
jgi:hypothetical protein